eukprot:TRINITY_DN895_c0_g1_i1.p2 TRINITY_DN895_c0_g1~~TRINITY_DN895_c0_g1_i1.p2  ORF type:complete len:387 (+),score=151.08 TRINITY_DN895_c0_g1_i1:45-1163(+)
MNRDDERDEDEGKEEEEQFSELEQSKIKQTFDEAAAKQRFDSSSSSSKTVKTTLAKQLVSMDEEPTTESASSSSSSSSSSISTTTNNNNNNSDTDMSSSSSSTLSTNTTSVSSSSASSLSSLSSSSSASVSSSSTTSTTMGVISFTERKGRLDGRKANQLRTIECERSLLNRADGSVRYTQGQTTVLVAVFGPSEVMMKHQEKIDRATVLVSFKSLTGSATNLDTYRSFVIRQALESIILSSLHPRTKISIIIQVIRDDGSLVSASLNAACLALLDAGIPCCGLLSSVTVAWSRKDELMFDPDHEEEKAAKGLVILAYQSQSKLGVVVSETKGIIGEKHYSISLDAGRKACDSIQLFFRKSLADKLKRQHTT